MIKVLIADDEPLAIRRMEIKLARYPDIEIIGTTQDGEATLNAFAKLKPDLVFLDISMPEMDGLDVAHHARRSGVAVIFVTAFNQFAVQAFEKQALDYLLKPVSQSRLDLAIARFRDTQKQNAALEEIKELNSVVTQLRAQNTSQNADHNASAQPRHNSELAPYQPSGEIWIKDQGRNRKILMSAIEWVEASRDYVTVHMMDGHTYFVRDTMQHFMTMLDTSVFQRVHRSTIVNIMKVKEVKTRKSVQYLRLHSDTDIRIGRAYKVATNLRLKEIFLSP